MYKRYKNQSLNEINTLNSNQSGDFWKLINKIRKNETVEESSDISSEDWIKHFQNLFYDETQESHGENVTFPNNLDQTTTRSDKILDAPITAKEIHDQTSKLKIKRHLVRIKKVITLRPVTPWFTAEIQEQKVIRRRLERRWRKTRLTVDREL